MIVLTHRQEEERRRREEEMMRQRELEEQMRRKREESYRMGGFMDNVSNAVRKVLAFKCHIFLILLNKTIFLLFFFTERKGDENEF